MLTQRSTVRIRSQFPAAKNVWIKLLVDNFTLSTRFFAGFLHFLPNMRSRTAICAPIHSTKTDGKPQELRKTSSKMCTMRKTIRLNSKPRIILDFVLGLQDVTRQKKLDKMRTVISVKMKAVSAPPGMNFTAYQTENNEIIEVGR